MKEGEEKNMKEGEEKRREEHERRRREEHERHINDLADRAIRGEFGNGETRKRLLGAEYKEVQNKVNEKLGNSYRYKI